MEQLIIEASSIECSEERREISGKIVPMGTGEVGQTNMGGVVFEAGSIDIADPSKIKLLSQHFFSKKNYHLPNCYSHDNKQVK
jgi:hypothetical protein